MGTAWKTQAYGWEDYTKMDFQEVVWGGMDWIDLWQAVVTVLMNLQVPYDAGKFLTS